MKCNGDLYLYGTENGGEIVESNGNPVVDCTFRTACYLSLYGGTADGSEWWGNQFQPDEKKITGNFINYLLANSKTSETIAEAEEYALLDLNWMIADGIVDNFDISIQSIDINRYDITVVGIKDEAILFENKYRENWLAMSNLR